MQKYIALHKNKRLVSTWRGGDYDRLVSYLSTIQFDQEQKNDLYFVVGFRHKEEAWEREIHIPERYEPETLLPACRFLSDASYRLESKEGDVVILAERLKTLIRDALHNKSRHHYEWNALPYMKDELIEHLAILNELTSRCDR